MRTGMCWWRFKGDKPWRFGYATQVPGTSMFRMGTYNGDTTGGTVVDPSDVETKEYSA